MNHKVWSGVFAAVIAVALAASAGAQDVQGAPEHFGGGEGTITIPAAAFVGMPAPDGSGFSNFEYPGVPGGSVTGQALLQLPNGAEITQLCVVGYDISWHGAVSLTLVGWEYPRIGVTATTPSRTLATASSPYGGQPGMSTWCAPPPPIRVGSFGDLDSNGVAGWTAYKLVALISYGPGGGATPDVSSVSFGAAVIAWRRTVSPAPAVASFTDVPTTHPLFRFVQAMVASGITGGCAAGQYCPDAPVTRGQMAVFFSVALGLHYPN